MKLKVIKKFNGKEEGKILNPGDSIVTTDLSRINTLVGRGFCVISSIENPDTEDGKAAEKDADKSKGKGKAKEE